MDPGLYGSRRWGVALGLLAAAAGLAAAELAAGLFRGSASPVVPVGQVFIDRVPTSVKDWAIRTFGTADKVVLVAGALIVVLGLGALIGVLAMRGARVAAYVLTAAIGVVGAWAVLIRPDPTLAKLAPTIVGSAVSIAVLWWLGPRPAATVEGPVETMTGPDRRRFLTGAVTIGAAAVVTGGLGRLLRQRSEIAGERAALRRPERRFLPHRHGARRAAGPCRELDAGDRWPRGAGPGARLRRPAGAPAGRAVHHLVVRVQRGRWRAGR
jgi:hypothetical protein